MAYLYFFSHNDLIVYDAMDHLALPAEIDRIMTKTKTVQCVIWFDKVRR